MRDELTTHHSSYYIDHSQPPAPLLISNGWADDFFRPTSRSASTTGTRTQFPIAAIRCSTWTSGTSAGRTRRRTRASAADSREEAWMDYYVRGMGSPAAPPPRGGGAHPDLPELGSRRRPYSAPSWAQPRPRARCAWTPPQPRGDSCPPPAAPALGARASTRLRWRRLRDPPPPRTRPTPRPTTAARCRGKQVTR